MKRSGTVVSVLAVWCGAMAPLSPPTMGDALATTPYSYSSRQVRQPRVVVVDRASSVTTRVTTSVTTTSLTAASWNGVVVSGAYGYGSRYGGYGYGSSSGTDRRIGSFNPAQAGAPLSEHTAAGAVGAYRHWQRGLWEARRAGDR